MSPSGPSSMEDHPPASEAEMADLLAACDEALARGDLSAAELSSSDSSAINLHRELDCLRLLRQAFPRQHAVNATRHDSLPQVPPLALTRLGRFEIRGELGRGGYGIVYHAFDPQLNRDVAIKVAREDLPSDTDLTQGLIREAQATARLQHPNIVTLFEQGVDDGRWFLVSEYCDGVSLSKWIRSQDHPVRPRQAAEIVRVLSLAVEHFHQQGVLHRDLKPGNVLLQKRGVDAVESRQLGEETTSSVRLPWIPKLTDFGLAKIADASASQITRSGLSLGTPVYMSPEQADRKGRSKIGPATDVYGLGTILFELLMRSPPFPIDTPLVTIQRVINEVPKFNHLGLPTDLVTICMKCLEKAPEARYASAAELADDLHHYLAGEPIRAKRVSMSGRVIRWVRRQPITAGLMATIMIVALVGLAAWRWEWSDARRFAKEKQVAQALFEGEQQRRQQEMDRADDHYERTRDILSHFTDFGFDLAGKPELDAEGLSLIEQSLKTYETLLKHQSGDVGLRLEYAGVLSRMAQLEWAIDRRDAALAHQQESVRLQRQVLEQPSIDRQARHHLGMTLAELAEMLRARRELGDAELASRESVELLRSMLDQDRTDDHARKLLIRSLQIECRLSTDRKHLDSAVLSIEHALKLQDELTVAHPDDLESARQRDALQEQLAFLHSKKQAVNEMRLLFSQTLPMLEEQWRQNSNDPEKCLQLVEAIARMYVSSQYLDDTELDHWYQRAVEVAEALLHSDPGNAKYQQLTTVALEHAAIRQHRMARYDAALSLAQKSRRLLEQRISKSDTSRVPLNLRMEYYLILDQERRILQGLSLYEDSLSVARQIVEIDPLNHLFPDQPGRMRLYRLNLLDSLLVKSGLTPAELSEAVRIAEDMRQTNDDVMSRTYLALVRLHQDQPQQSIALLENCSSRMEASSVEYSGESSPVHCHLTEFTRALALARVGNDAAARSHLRAGRLLWVKSNGAPDEFLSRHESSLNAKLIRETESILRSRKPFQVDRRFQTQP